MAKDTNNQNQDDQNYDVDILSIYKNYISQIDRIRGFKNFQGIRGTSFNVINTTANDANVQESRTSAFYRLLGLPISDGSNIYSPGFDLDNNHDVTAKLNIAKNISDDMYKIFDLRDSQFKKYNAIFYNGDVDSIVLSMSSAEIKDFGVPLNKNTGSFDTDATNQNYNNSLISKLAGIVSHDGQMSEDPLSTRFKLLKPFMVDPRTDLGLTDASKIIATPFATDKSKLKFGDDSYVIRPYIESVCRTRFATYENQSEYINSIISYVKDDVDNPTKTLVDKVFNNGLIDETIKINNFINIIRSVLNALSNAVDDVLTVLVVDKSYTIPTYNWISIPEQGGPELGSKAKKILNQLDSSYNSLKDFEIINLNAINTLNGITAKVASAPVVDLGSFAFENIELSPDADSSADYGNSILKNLQSCLEERQIATDLADNGLQIIEIITGEFSGIGLLDILAISMTFWSIDKETILNLLDETVLNRMTAVSTLTDPLVLAMKDKATKRTMSPDQVLQSFQKQLLNVYQLIQGLYNDIRNSNEK
jgi:hypothetical protein